MLDITNIALATIKDWMVVFDPKPGDICYFHVEIADYDRHRYLTIITDGQNYWRRVEFATVCDRIEITDEDKSIIKDAITEWVGLNGERCED